MTDGNKTSKETDTKRDDLVLQLKQLIDQYIDEAKKIEAYRNELAEKVYHLLDNVLFKSNLDVYLDTCASALGTIAIHRDSVADSFIKIMGEEQLDSLCELLQYMVVFCHSIKNSEVCLAQLDQVQWHDGDNGHLPLQSLKKAKIEYERRLQVLHVLQESSR